MDEILSEQARAQLTPELQQELREAWRYAEETGDGTLLYAAMYEAQEQMGGQPIVEGDDWNAQTHPKEFLYRIIGGMPSWPGDARYQRMSDWTVEWFYIAVAGVLAYTIWQALKSTFFLLLPALVILLGVLVGLFIASKRSQ